MMDPYEEDGMIIQLSEEEEEQQPLDQLVPPIGNQDQIEETSTQAQEDNSDAEWDTDLETDSRLQWWVDLLITN